MHSDVAGLLRELVAFLERLAELELPEAMQSGRDELLKRSRAVLESSTHTTSDSPEPYLDMSAGRTSSCYNNSILSAGTDALDEEDETDRPQEYVGPDSQRQLQRGSLHYYETFQEFQVDNGKENGKTEAEKEIDDLVLLYASFSAAQAKEKSLKCGNLMHLRRERKMFAPFNVFWLNRWCWASLVGSHLLLYANDRESRPMLVIGLGGYSSRAAPNAMGKEARRGEAAFELYCPGERTFQFVAKSNQEMRDWLNALSHRSEADGENGGEGAGSRKPRSLSEILELESNERMCIERVRQEKIARERDLARQRETKRKEPGASPKSKSKDSRDTKQKHHQAKSSKSSTPDKEKLDETVSTPSTTNAKEDAPPLPARRGRLPSLPSQDQVSYEPREELYDEEGLYHRIEDIRAQQQEKQRQREYQNCQLIKPLEASRTKTTVDLLQETYDDVETSVNRSPEALEPMETYDDVHSVQTKDRGKDEPTSCDDAQASSENSRSARTPTKDAKSKSPKQGSKATTPKRSFLDRVRSLKDATTRKDEKRPSVVKSSTPPPSTPTPEPETPELPSYDDVSSITDSKRAQTNQQQGEIQQEEEYLTPPPPRPIYSRPPTIIKCATPVVPSDEIYDDIGSGPQPVEINGCKGCANVDVIKNYPKNGSFLSDLQLSIEREHYQVPRSNRPATAPPSPPSTAPPTHEELYDDVALSETFKNRPRDPAIAPSVWSRIGGAAAKSVPRIFTDRAGSQLDEEANVNKMGADAGENGVGVSTSVNARIKPLHKLIVRMESSLGKGTPVKIVGNN